MLSTLHTAVEQLRGESEWHRFALLVSLLGAGLDGWLSPAIIPNSSMTGELNPISLFHATGPVTFALARVLVVVAVVSALSLAVYSGGRNLWSDAPLAWFALWNAANGVVAAASALASVWVGHLAIGTFATSSIVALAVAALAATAVEYPTAAQNPTAGLRSCFNTIMSFDTDSASERIRAVFLVFIVVLSIPAVMTGGLGGGTTGVASADHGGEHVDDFEDGDLNIEATEWTGWEGDTGSLEITSESVNDSYSAQITGTGGSLNQVSATRSTGFSPSRFGFRFNITSADSADDDAWSILRNGSTNIVMIRRNDNSGELEVRESGGDVSTNYHINRDVEQRVEVKNINWSNNNFDLYANGRFVGTFNFRNDDNQIDTVQFKSDATSNQFRFDDVEFDGSDFPNESFDVEFWDSVDNETADTGTPENWKPIVDPSGSGHTRNVDVEKVTRNRSFSGEKSYYAEESQGSNAVTSMPAMQPFDRYVTLNASIVLNRPEMATEKGAVGLALYEGTGDTPQVNIQHRNGSLLYTDSSGTRRTISDKPDVGEWVWVKVYDIDLDTDTFSVEWETDSGERGRSTGLEMQSPMHWGYSETVTTIDDRGYIDELSIGRETGLSTFNVQLVDQNGDPVRRENVTTQIWGVNENQLAVDPSEAEHRSKELMDEASDPWPDQFDPNQALDDTFENANGEYVAVNTREEWSGEEVSFAQEYHSRQYAGDIDLRRSDPFFKSGSELHLSIWDPEDPAGNRFVSGRVGYPVDHELPGSTTDGEVVVERLSPTGEVVSSKTVGTERTVKTCGYSNCALDGKWHETAALELSDGLYRASASDSHVKTYFVVGEAESISHQFTQDLRDKANALTQRAESLRELTDEGRLEDRKSVTDSNGTAQISVHPAVSQGSVLAYNAPLDEVQGVSDPRNLQVEDLKEARESGYNGTFVHGERPLDLSNIEDGDTITVEVRSTTMAPHGDIEKFLRLQEWISDLASEDLDQLPPGWEQDLDNLSEEELRDLYRELANTIRGIPLAEERYEARHGTSVPDADDLGTRADLQREIVNLAQILEALPSDSLELPEDPRIEDGMLSMEVPVDGQIDEDATSVMLHWSDGSAPEVMDEEFWSTESTTTVNPFGGDTLVIEDFPIEERANGRALADVRPTIVMEEGEDSQLARPSIPVENPAFEGSVPKVDAWELSKIRPGPDETVSVRLRSRDDSFGSLQNVSAYAPDGTQLQTSRDGQKVWFKTDGAGPHTIRASYTDRSGATFVDSIRLKALDQAAGEPPTVRWERGVGHDVAIVGEGLQSARLEDSGEEVSVTVVQTDGRTPIGNLHVHVEEEVSGGEIVELAILHPDDSNIQSEASVKLHTTIDENTLLYRNDKKPIVHSGETYHGDVKVVTGSPGDRPARVIRTQTDSRGQLTVETIDDPSSWERMLHSIRASGLGLGGLLSLGSWVVPVGYAVQRRREIA